MVMVVVSGEEEGYCPVKEAEKMPFYMPAGLYTWPSEEEEAATTTTMPTTTTTYSYKENPN